jgi:hypothetical protein
MAQCGPLTESPSGGTKCTNTSYYYSVPLGFSNYNWNITNGTVTSGGISTTNWVYVRWDKDGTSRIVSVNYGTSCYSALNITNMPAQPAITGPANVCKSTTRQFSIPSSSPVLWQVESGPATVAANQTTLLNPNIAFGATSGVVALSVTVGSSCQTKGYFYVTVENGIGSISGPSTATNCSDYTISGTGIIWSVTAKDGFNNTGNTVINGGNLQFAQGINPMRFWWRETVKSATITATYTSPAGCATTATFPVNTITHSSTLASSTGGLPTADGCSTQDYSIVGTSPTWTVAGGSLVYQQGLNPMRIKWNGTGATSSIKVKYTNNAGCTQEDSSPITVNPLLPTLVPLDGLDPTQYCFRAARTFVTDAGMTSYDWSFNGSVEQNSSLPKNNQGVVILPYTPTTTTNTTTLGSAFALYGNVSVSVSYSIGGCVSAPKTINMTVTPASITYNGNTTFPFVCSTGGNNIGAYVTDAGYSNYLWVAIPDGTKNSGTAVVPTPNPNPERAKMNWSGTFFPSSKIGVKVTYTKNALGCNNTNLTSNPNPQLAEYGRYLTDITVPLINGSANPSSVVYYDWTQPSPPPVSPSNTPVFNADNNNLGHQFTWTVNPATNYRFTNGSGVPIDPNPTPSNPEGSSQTNIQWRVFAGTGPLDPTVTLNYYMRYPTNSSNSADNISLCTNTKTVAVKSCILCNDRKASHQVMKDQWQSQ